MAGCTLHRPFAIAVAILALGVKGIGSFWGVIAVRGMAFAARIRSGALFFEVMMTIVACETVT